MKNKEEIREYDKKYWKQYYKKNKKKILVKARERNKIKKGFYQRHKKIENSTHKLIISMFKKDCGICHTKEDLQIHHFKYRIPIQRQDFSILCRSCHQIIHR